VWLILTGDVKVFADERAVETIEDPSPSLDQDILRRLQSGESLLVAEWNFESREQLWTDG
jgi:hypothetical protein